MPYITKYASSLAPTFGWYVDTTHTEKSVWKVDDGGGGGYARGGRLGYIYLFMS